MRLRILLRPEAAETPIGALIGIIIGTLVVGGLVLLAANGAQAFSTYRHSIDAQTNGQLVVDRLERDAGSARSVFVPTTDVAGASNSDGHQVSYYVVDAQGNGSFASYCFTAAAADCSSAQSAKTLARYTYVYGTSAQPDSTSNGIVTAVPLTSFSASTLYASDLLNAAKNPISAAYFAARGVTHVTDVARQTGYPGVVVGNQVTAVTIGTGVETRAVHLVAKPIAGAQQVVVATYTPAPFAFTASTNTLSFKSPLAAAQSFLLSENNYGTRTTSPAQDYWLGSSTCATVGSTAPGSPLAPANNGTGNATVTFTPVVHVAPAGESCTLTYDDNVPQGTTVSIVVGATHLPLATAPTAVLAGSAFAATFSEQNYPVPAGTVSASVASGPCTTPALSSGADDGSGTYNASYSVTATAPGSCILSFTDSYGQYTTATITAYGPISLAPSSISVGIGSAVNVTASESNYPGAIYDQSTSCAGIAAITDPGGGSWTNNGTTYYGGGLGPGPVDFSVTGASPGNCTFTVAGYGGAPPQSVSVNVYGNLVVSPNALNVGVGGSATALGTEVDYGGPIVIQSTTCGGIASVGGNGSGPGPVPFTVTGSAAGTCTFTVAGGADSPTQTVAVDVHGKLVVTPKVINIGIGAHTAVTASEADYSGPLYDQSDDCVSGGYATITNPGGGSWTYNGTTYYGGGLGPGPRYFTITGQNAGTCTLNVADTNGAVTPVTINVYGALAITPSLTWADVGTFPNPTGCTYAPGPCSLTPVEAGYSGAITVTPDTSCSNAWSFNADGTWTPGGVSVASGANIDVAPQYNVNCFATATDTNGQAVTVTLNAGSPILYSKASANGPWNTTVTENFPLPTSPAHTVWAHMDGAQGPLSFGTSCAGYASVTQTSATTGNATFRVQPDGVNSGAPLCEFYAISDVGNPGSNVQVNVGATPVPAPPGPLQVSLDNSSWGPSVSAAIDVGQTIPVYGQKTNSTDPLEVQPGTFCGFESYRIFPHDGVGPAPPPLYLTQTIATLGGSGSAPDTAFNLVGGPSATGSDSNGALVVPGSDACDLAVYDPITGESAPVYVTVAYVAPPPPPVVPPAVGPILVSTTSGGPWFPAISMTWSVGATADQWFYAFDPNNPANPNNVYLTPASGGNCGNFAIGSATSGGAYNPASSMPGNYGYGSGQYASWTSHVASAFDGSQCTLTVSDTYGSQPASVTLVAAPAPVYPPQCPVGTTGTPPNCIPVTAVTMNGSGALHAQCATIPSPPIIEQDWRVVCGISGSASIYNIPTGEPTDTNGNTPIVLTSSIGGDPDFSGWGMTNQAGVGTSAILYVNNGGNISNFRFTINADGSASLVYPGALPATPYIWITASYRWGPIQGGNPLDADIAPFTIQATIGS